MARRGQEIKISTGTDVGHSGKTVIDAGLAKTTGDSVLRQITFRELVQNVVAASAVAHGQNAQASVRIDSQPQDLSRVVAYNVNAINGQSVTGRGYLPSAGTEIASGYPQAREVILRAAETQALHNQGVRPLEDRPFSNPRYGIREFVGRVAHLIVGVSTLPPKNAHDIWDQHSSNALSKAATNFDNQVYTQAQRLVDQARPVVELPGANGRTIYAHETLTPHGVVHTDALTGEALVHINDPLRPYLTGFHTAEEIREWDRGY